MSRIGIKVTGQTPNSSYKPNTLLADIIKEIDHRQAHFFDSQIDSLLSKINNFFDENSNSPFPLIVHVLPPNDSTDAKPFLDALATLNVPIIKKQIYHIQIEKLILFHPSPVPIDIPKIALYTECFNAQSTLNRFIILAMEFMFSFGFTPPSDFALQIRKFFDERYHSISMLFNAIRATMSELVLTTTNFNKEVDFSLTESLFQKASFPTPLKLKLRVDALYLLESLLKRYNLPQYLMAIPDNYTEFDSVETYKELMNAMDKDDEIDDFLIETAGHLGCLFQIKDLVPTESKKKAMNTRRSRLQSLVQTKTPKSGTASTFDKVMKKLFQEIPKTTGRVARLSAMMGFNPISDMKESLKTGENDTSIAYQILQEQEKVVGAADWFNAFSAQIKCDDNGVALGRFQNAVSELEYLGFVDQKTRVENAFRRRIRF